MQQFLKRHLFPMLNILRYFYGLIHDKDMQVLYDFHL